MRQRAIVPALLALMVIAADAPAQWLNLPTPGIPRTADGKPDLNAPTPRTADGKPDLSGIWDNGRNTNIPQRGGRGADFNAPPPANRGQATPTNAGPPNATFSNVGAGFPD